MKSYWKPAVVVLLLLGIVAFVATRWRTAFQGSAPDFLKAREETSPALWTDGRLRHSWSRVEQFLKQAVVESNTVHEIIRSLELVDVGEEAGATLRWDTEEWMNPGFAPLARIESRIPAAAGEFVGYYTWGGEGVRYVSKQDPGNANVRLTTILLDQPIPPGGTGWLFRVQHQASRVTSNKNNQLQVNLGRLPGPDAGVHGRGIVLPGAYKLGEYRPADSAFYARRDEDILVFWFNSQLPPDNPALHVTFTRE